MRLTPTISGFLALSLALQALPVFAEMPPEAYDDAIAYLENAQIIDGFAAGNPRTYEYLNRAEALKIIVKSRPELLSDVANVARAMPPIPLFSDVDQTQWYAPYIEVAFKHGLIKGYPDGRFWPQAGVKTSEAAAMLARAYGEPLKDTSFRTSAELQNIEGQWFTGAVSSIIARSAVMPGNPLRLGGYMKRGEFFDMTYRIRIAHADGSPLALRPPVLPIPRVSISSSSSSVSSVASVAIASQQQTISAKPFAISIPSLGITDLTITHPEDPSSQKGVLAVLKDGVGHLLGFPGDGGKILVYGHSSGYPWDLSEFTKIFRTINKMEVGDNVYVTRNGQLFTYQVTEKRTVNAKDKSAFEPDDNGEELILYTCWPPDSITHRFLVIAKPVDAVALK